MKPHRSAQGRKWYWSSSSWSSAVSPSRAGAVVTCVSTPSASTAATDPSCRTHRQSATSPASQMSAPAGSCTQHSTGYICCYPTSYIQSQPRSTSSVYKPLEEASAKASVLGEQNESVMTSKNMQAQNGPSIMLLEIASLVMLSHCRNTS